MFQQIPPTSFFVGFLKEMLCRYFATKKEYDWGFHGRIVINSTRLITEGTFTETNIDERDVRPELLVGKINVQIFYLEIISMLRLHYAKKT